MTDTQTPLEIPEQLITNLHRDLIHARNSFPNHSPDQSRQHVLNTWMRSRRGDLEEIMDYMFICGRGCASIFDLAEGIVADDSWSYLQELDARQPLFARTKPAPNH